MRLPKCAAWMAIVALMCLTSFRTFGDEAPAEGAPSGERISQDGMVDLEAGDFSGVLNRLNLDPSNFGVSQAKPGPNGEKPAGEKPTNEPAPVVAKKKEDEEEAPAGSAQGELDLASLKLSEAQVSAVEKAIADGVDLTAFTAEELKEFGFQPEQVTEFQRLLSEVAPGGAATGEAALEKLGLTAEQQTAVKALLDAKAGTPAEEATKLKGDLEKANGEVQRLNGELTKKPTTGVAIAPLHPVFMLNDDAKLAQREQEIMEFERWAAVNWDGTEEIPASGDKPAVRAFTKEEVRARHAELQQERQTLIPRARQVLAAQRQYDAQAAEIYPELKDTKSEMSTTVNNILQRAPGLAALFPNVRIIIADAIAGEKARLAKAKATSGAAKGLKLKVGTSASKVAPKLPMGARPAKPAAGGRSVKPADNIDEGAFVEMLSKGSSDRDALVTLLGKTNLVGRS